MSYVVFIGFPVSRDGTLLFFFLSKLVISNKKMLLPCKITNSGDRVPPPSLSYDPELSEHICIIAR